MAGNGCYFLAFVHEKRCLDIALKSDCLTGILCYHDDGIGR